MLLSARPAPFAHLSGSPAAWRPRIVTPAAVALVLAALVLAAAPAGFAQAPGVQVAGPTADGAVLLASVEQDPADGPSLCLGARRTATRGALAGGICGSVDLAVTRPHLGTASDARGRVLLAAVSPKVTSLEVELVDGTRVRTDSAKPSVAARARLGRTYGAGRFAIAALPASSRVLLVRSFAADGTLVAAVPLDPGGLPDLPDDGPPRRVAVAPGPGGLSVVETRRRELRPVPGALDRLERVSCLALRGPGVRASLIEPLCRDAGPPGVPAQVVTARRGCAATGVLVVVSDRVRDVRLVRGDSRRLAMSLVRVAREGAGALRVAARSVGPATSIQGVEVVVRDGRRLAVPASVAPARLACGELGDGSSDLRSPPLAPRPDGRLVDRDGRICTVAPRRDPDGASCALPPTSTEDLEAGLVPKGDRLEVAILAPRSAVRAEVRERGRVVGRLRRDEEAYLGVWRDSVSVLRGTVRRRPSSDRSAVLLDARGRRLASVALDGPPPPKPVIRRTGRRRFGLPEVVVRYPAAVDAPAQRCRDLLEPRGELLLGECPSSNDQLFDTAFASASVSCAPRRTVVTVTGRRRRHIRLLVRRAGRIVERPLDGGFTLLRARESLVGVRAPGRVTSLRLDPAARQCGYVSSRLL